MFFGRALWLSWPRGAGSAVTVSGGNNSRWAVFVFTRRPKRVNRIDKFVHISEVAMDRRVTQIRHFIDVAQFLQHFCANLRGADFAAARFQIVNDFVDCLFQSDQTDRTFLKRLCHAAGELCGDQMARACGRA